jgi:general secretion pathway protein M
VTKPDREQAISIGVLAATLLVCVAAVGVSLQVRSNAAQELDDGRDRLARLEARVKARNDARARSGATAPATAFLDAPTQGMAVAQLQAYMQRLADVHHCVLVSSGLEPTKHDDPADSIRLQATMEASGQSLQAFLYQLESGTPYVFVGSLTIQLTGAASQHMEDPLLRVTFGLRAVWRRGMA